MEPSELEALLARVRTENCSICGLEVTIGGVSIPLTDEEFDAVWDAMGEYEEAIISLPSATRSPAPLPDSGRSVAREGQTP